MRWCLALVIACGCQSVAGGGGGGGDDEPMIDAPRGSGGATVFDAAITNVIVEVDYEAGQQPYTGPILGFGDTFDPTLTNIDRLFASKKTLAIPTTIGAMENVGQVNDEELTVADIQALAAQ